MFNRLKRLYDAGRLSKAGLETAVLRGWITEEQMREITGEPAPTETAPKASETAAAEPESQTTGAEDKKNGL